MKYCLEDMLQMNRIIKGNKMYTLREVTKYYEYWNIRKRKKEKTFVIKNMDLDITSNEIVCVMGKSGVGKTTLLKMLGGIEIPSGGSIRYKGTELYNCSDKEMEDYRRKEIGFVFQDYKLLNEMTIEENILVPQILDHIQRKQAVRKMKKLAKTFGLENKLSFYPYELSGGEKQRAAFCRALINDPQVILADEPTGNLDEQNTKMVLDIIESLKEKLGKTIIIVTHDKEVCEIADRVIYMGK